MSHNGDGDISGYAADDAVRTAQIKEAALQHVRAAHREAEVLIQNRIEMLIAARSFGATWDDLGAAMSMSRQTAHKRFGRQVERGVRPSS